MATRQFFSYFLLVCFAFLTSGTAGAFQFTPFSLGMTPQEQPQFTVTNDSELPIAVEISLKKRDMDAKGEDKLTDGEEFFSVYPMQLIVKGKTSRTVRVRYLGDLNLKSEEAYRIIAEQLPTDLQRRGEKGGAQVQVMLKYVASLYVRPKDAKSHVVVESVAKGVNSSGKLVLRVAVKNQGTRHTLLEKAELHVGNVVLKEKELEGLANNNVLAGGQRVFEVPLPAALSSVNNFQGAQLTYQQSY